MCVALARPLIRLELLEGVQLRRDGGRDKRSKRYKPCQEHQHKLDLAPVSSGKKKNEKKNSHSQRKIKANGEGEGWRTGEEAEMKEQKDRRKRGR